eukprot:182283-Rhodomonas_salina.1
MEAVLHYIVSLSSSFKNVTRARPARIQVDNTSESRASGRGRAADFGSRNARYVVPASVPPRSTMNLAATRESSCTSGTGPGYTISITSFNRNNCSASFCGTDDIRSWKLANTQKLKKIRKIHLSLIHISEPTRPRLI